MSLTPQSALRRCRRSPNALLIGGSKVPSFALFEFIVSPSGDALQTNNAKGGSCVADAAQRSSLGVADASSRLSWVAPSRDDGGNS